MKFCIQAELKFDSVAKRDAIVSHAKGLIRGRSRWRERIADIEVISGVDMYEDEPIMSVMVRFDLENDMRDVFKRVKEKMQTVSGVHGIVKIHKCEHDTQPFKPCVIEKEFVI